MAARFSGVVGSFHKHGIAIRRINLQTSSQTSFQTSFPTSFLASGPTAHEASTTKLARLLILRSRCAKTPAARGFSVRSMHQDCGGLHAPAKPGSFAFTPAGVKGSG